MTVLPGIEHIEHGFNLLKTTKVTTTWAARRSPFPVAL